MTTQVKTQVKKDRIVKTTTTRHSDGSGSRRTVETMKNGLFWTTAGGTSKTTENTKWGKKN